MIRYDSAFFHPRLLFQVKGSPFPFSLLVATPCAAISVAFQLFRQHRLGDAEEFFENILNNNAGYTSFTFLCGFLIVFRTQQGYGRFCDGLASLKAMQAEWYAAASNLIAFCRHSKQSSSEILRFHHILLRLMSLLHAVALAELEGQDEDKEPVAFRLELIDARGIDAESLDSLREVECLVELIVQWVQSLTVMHINTGVLTIPPPILARVFHNLSNGLGSFHQAKKLTDVPYPFPFMQATEWLLVLHWLVTPIVMTNFTDRAVWAGVFSFLAVFILWTLNTIATELENPFGEDANDLHTEEMQNEMNKRYLTLLWPQANRIPTLSSHAILDEAALHHPESMLSLQEVWDNIDKKGRMQRERSNNFRLGRNFRNTLSASSHGSIYSRNSHFARFSQKPPAPPSAMGARHVSLADTGQVDRRSIEFGRYASGASSIAAGAMGTDTTEYSSAVVGLGLRNSHKSNTSLETNQPMSRQFSEEMISISSGQSNHQKKGVGDHKPTRAPTRDLQVVFAERSDSSAEARLASQNEKELPVQLHGGNKPAVPGRRFILDDPEIARLPPPRDPRAVGYLAAGAGQGSSIAEGPGDIGPDPPPLVSVH